MLETLTHNFYDRAMEFHTTAGYGVMLGWSADQGSLPVSGVPSSLVHAVTFRGFGALGSSMMKQNILETDSLSVLNHAPP